VRRTLLAAATGAACLAALAAAFPSAAPRPLPSYREVRAAWQPSEARLLDCRGEILHELRVDPTARRLEWTSLSEVSPALVRAVLRSEDKRFHEHAGADWFALAGAAAQAVLGDGRRGASTVTMQLLSLLHDGPGRGRARRSVRQKLLQIREGLALERRWTKGEILEAYLNLVSWRGELVGIRAASRGLFGKEPAGLDEPESAVLAALIRAPNAAPADVGRRAERLSGSLGSRPPPGRAASLAREALSSPYAIDRRADLAPHAARMLLSRERPEVRSTLDADLQRSVREALERQLLSLQGRNVGDGAALVVENRTGEILAYVGNAGALSSAAHVDGIRAPRQAGSALKPFLYGLALERRILTAASLLDDSPLDVPTEVGSYAPRNYDRGYRGPVSLRTALAGSLNIPAVRTQLLLPPDAFAARLRDLGFDRVRDGEDHGAALALGAADVTLLQLVSAYRALANGGVAGPLTLLRRDTPARGKRILSPGASFIVSDILSDRGAREATFGLENLLSTPFRTAVKTGTSKDMRDNWCVGFSKEYTVGVWVGNFRGDPMWNVSGISGAAPVWAEVMGHLHRERPASFPSPPPGVVPHRVAFPGEVEGDRTEWFIAGTEPFRTVPARAIRGIARIRYPSDGMVVALDPDIPPGRQLVFLEAAGGDAAHSLVLDGVRLGTPDRLLPWRPQPGAHTLSLVDGDGSVVDTVSFSVRGTPIAGR